MESGKIKNMNENDFEDEVVSDVLNFLASGGDSSSFYTSSSQDSNCDRD